MIKNNTRFDYIYTAIVDEFRQNNLKLEIIEQPDPDLKKVPHLFILLGEERVTGIYAEGNEKVIDEYELDIKFYAAYRAGKLDYNEVIQAGYNTVEEIERCIELFSFTRTKLKNNKYIRVKGLFTETTNIIPLEDRGLIEIESKIKYTTEG